MSDINDRNTYYLGNQKLKRANVPVNYTKPQIKEFMRCSTDVIYFIKKYIKIVNVDRGIIPFDLWEFQEKMVQTFATNRFSICKLPRQSGKALDIETQILTTLGFKQLKNLNIGDYVYGPDGLPTKITFITETMFNHDVYNVYFDNGDIIKADAEHLWTVKSTNWDNKQKDLTTEELIRYTNHTSKPYIDFTQPLNFEHKNLLLDPYTLGMWLGDGATNGNRIYCHKDDFIHYKNTINVKNFVEQTNDNVVRFTFEGGQTILKQIGVFGNKHIPNDYLFSSFEQRLELLRGLMDSDGSVSESGSYEFYQKNEDFIDQFRILLSSMGIKSRKSSKKINDCFYWTVRYQTNLCVFKLQRKIDKHKCLNHPKNKRLYITKIEKVESVPVRCLQVDNESHLFLCGETLIPTHNTTVVAAVILWYVLFHETFSVALLAHKLSQSREILGRIQLAYENLPKWMQQGVLEWNKGNVLLENGSKIMAAATSSSAVRGGSFNFIYLDEFAFVPAHFQAEFFASVYPTISSGVTTKVVITSTPKGLNMFYKMWKEAVDGKNSFVPVEIHWSDIPGRDEKWKEETIRNTSERQFREEYETEFVGSASTLINPGKLLQLPIVLPMKYTDDYAVYEDPSLEENKKNLYVLVADTARGVGGDYSAFVVFNCSAIPYKVAARYKNNEISPLIFPNIVHQFAKMYNEAYVCIEINDNGQQVADILYRDLEYENMVMSQVKGAKGQMLSSGFSSRPNLGVRTTKQLKRIGCTNLKTLIESDKIIVEDAEIIDELYRFVETNESYAAEEGTHDDLVMCCVIFAWMTMQPYFKDWSDTNIRERLQFDNSKMLDDDLLPFAINDGYNDYNDIQTLSGKAFNNWLFSQND